MIMRIFTHYLSNLYSGLGLAPWREFIYTLPRMEINLDIFLGLVQETYF